MKKILIIEDEDAISLALEAYIISIGYEVTDCVTNADDARISASSTRPDLIISDIMIKGHENGAIVSKELYDLYKIPILFITAHLNNKILDEILGAKICGYMMKPYKQEELKAILRLALGHKDSENKSYIKFGDYEFDLEEKVILKDMQTIEVGKKALLLIEILLKCPNQIISHDILMYKLSQDGDNCSMDCLRHIVKRVQEKLDFSFIISVRGEGYKYIA